MDGRNFEFLLLFYLTFVIEIVFQLLLRFSLHQIYWLPKGEGLGTSKMKLRISLLSNKYKNAVKWIFLIFF